MEDLSENMKENLMELAKMKVCLLALIRKACISSMITRGILCYSNEGAPNVDCNNLNTSAEYESFLGKLAEEKKFIDALRCIETLKENGHDLIHLTVWKARIHAWDQNYKEAKKAIRGVTGFEATLLKGDIAWYEGKCKRALKYYRQVKKAIKIPPHVFINYTKCLALVKRNKTAVKYLKKHESEFQGPDSDIVKLKTWLKEHRVEEKEKRRLAKLAAQPSPTPPPPHNIGMWGQLKRTDQSQDQTLQEIKIGAVYEYSFVKTTLDHVLINRTFPEKILKDTYNDFGLHFNLKPIVMSLVYGSSQDPKFSFLQKIELDLSYYYLSWAYVGLLHRTSFYEAQSVRLYAPYAGLYLSDFHFMLKYNRGLSEENSSSFSLRADHESRYFLASLTYENGEGEASRPYLLTGNRSSFNSIGTQLKFIYFPSWFFSLGYGNLTEDKYTESSIIFGLGFQHNF